MVDLMCLVEVYTVPLTNAGCNEGFALRGKMAFGVTDALCETRLRQVRVEGTVTARDCGKERNKEGGQTSSQWVR